MASSAALAAVADASGGPAQAALSSLPGLQLLLRILPFRRHGSSSQQQQQLLAKVRLFLGNLRGSSQCNRAILYACMGSFAAHSLYNNLASCSQASRSQFDVHAVVPRWHGAGWLESTPGVAVAWCCCCSNFEHTPAQLAAVSLRSQSGRHAPTSQLSCVCTAALSMLPVQLPRHQALEELHRHPLWRYGSTAAQWPEPRQGNNQPLAASEAESALLAYVRMAAEAEQHAGTQRPRRSRQQLSTADIAAELHALYTLAAIHVSQQQCPNPHLGSTGSAHSGQQALPDGDVMQLLKAYASLEDRSQHGSGHGGQGSQHGSHSWDNKTQAAAAAAMEAFWAFATLADAPQQEQTQQDAQQEVPHGTPQQAQPLQQSGQAPGQLQAGSGPCSSSPAHGHKQAPTGRIIQGSSSDDSNRSVNSAPGDLQVLLQLAQLSLQAAS